MYNVISFGASSSKNSINKKLVSYVKEYFPNANYKILDLNDYEPPLFCVDRETEEGYPKVIYDFLNKIEMADLLIISFAEHNGSYTAAYKSLFDWSTRINRGLYKDKKIILLSTSPGRNGANRVMALALEDIKRFGGQIVGYLSIPSFNHNFDTSTGKLTNPELVTKLSEIIANITTES